MPGPYLLACRLNGLSGARAGAGLLLAGVLAVGARSAAAQGAVGGVYVDPAGMLRETSSLSPTDLRLKLEIEPGADKTSPRPATASSLRKISLRRLEQAVEERRDAGRPLPSEMRFLAGLGAIKYVFFYPESNDVVLAGPAEGWELLPSGDAVGTKSRRPVLQLDDLIVALRYAFAEQPDGSFLGCSIEPTEQGLKAHAAYVRRLGRIEDSQVAQIVSGMEQAIGPQNILVYGAEGPSRFALEMVAADYRLKRIALAHDPSPSKKVPSYLDLAEKSATGGPQKQHRWWFVGHYDAIRHTADRLAFEFEGTGLKVETAPARQKNAVGGARPTRAATQFAELATKNLAELAEHVPAFAELQNLVGLALAGVLVQKQAQALPDNHGPAGGGDEARPAAPKGGWRPAHFLNDKDCAIARYETPRQTPPLANARFVKDQFWMFSVSGGVEIDPRSIAGGESLKPAGGEKLGAARRQNSAPADATSWWWD